MTDHGKAAGELFSQGYNCAQAVLMAFGDITGMEAEDAARLASSFGGGLGRMREVCGAVSGASMVLGIARGYSDPSDNASKSAHYNAVRELADRFREKNGSIICRELLAGVSVTPGVEPEKRTEAYYKKRPCRELVEIAADILDEMLSE